ncbi:hypothetical protein GLOIN_2v1877169 [Rhizophagus clarus]|uniref:TLDc domain-containing protein n=1 Tax=Rhizophagus clarus TaxID=94130 RepID=A0A8H3LPN4_9GLOM|nr:hypothetical protein GLOIN_2v1877169 [Rhizophagus clarus]
MIILYYRSPFLRRTLSSNKNKDNGVLAHIKLPNISPEIFQIILKYIYGGIISLNEQEPSEILKILVAADQLNLQELIDYLQKYLIENKSEWVEQHFELIYQTDPTTWSDNDFKMMENTLQNCSPLIRFFSLSSDEFVQKVHPYKKLLKHQLYEELLNSYLNSNSEPNDNILLPRYRNVDGIIDSKIVNLNIASLISRWIDNDIKSKFSYARELYLPYEFKLLLRGTRDGFTPKRFHELCNDISHTVTFIKIKGTEEIIGGYNPLKWNSGNVGTRHGTWGETKDTFIFSFKSKNNFKDSILSHVKNMKKALLYHANCGPIFGKNDLHIFVSGDNDLKEYDQCWCRQETYEKKIRDTGGQFSVEDYEVFQIIKKKNSV